MSSVAATQFLPVVATAGAENDSLIVSIHDIAPENREVIDAMLTDLGGHGVRVTSLLVVPHYHHRRLISDDPEFISWLRDLESAGHEVVIHGFFHSRPANPSDSLKERFITNIYTQSEGEFFDLSYDEALARIQSAARIFAEARLTPRGFIAPAWLLSPEGERAARDAGMEYTTRLRSVLDLRSGHSFAARSLVYSVRNHWRRTMSRAWNRALFQTMSEHRLLRLSLHPPDRQFPRVWKQIGKFLSEVKGTRTPTTYRDWMAERRLQAAA